MVATSSSRSSPTPSDRRAVARVLGAKGLKGGLRVEILTDWPERLAPDAEVWPEGESAARRIDHVETGGRVPVIHLDGIATREAAEALAGRYLEVPSRELDAGTYYWDDLVGLRVEASDGGRSASSSRSSVPVATRCTAWSGRQVSGSCPRSAGPSSASISTPGSWSSLPTMPRRFADRCGSTS
jgi:hypothetical protein